MNAAPLIRLVIASLPDSVSARISILRDLVTLLPQKNPHRPEVVRLLMKLESHDQLQRELPLLFTK